MVSKVGSHIVDYTTTVKRQKAKRKSSSSRRSSAGRQLWNIRM